MKDPRRSWQKNEGSLKILTRILKIFRDLPKIYVKIFEGPHEDPVRSLKIFERFSLGLVSMTQNLMEGHGRKVEL